MCVTVQELQSCSEPGQEPGCCQNLAQQFYHCFCFKSRKCFMLNDEYILTTANAMCISALRFGFCCFAVCFTRCEIYILEHIPCICGTKLMGVSYSVATSNATFTAQGFRRSPSSLSTGIPFATFCSTLVCCKSSVSSD